MATQEFSSLHALTWDFDTNAPHFEQIMTVAGSPVSNHWQDVTFAPAGIAEIRTTLPTADEYQIRGTFGVIDGLDAVPLPGAQTAITRYAYNPPTQTGNPPEARPNKGVMSVVEDSVGNHSLIIVLDKSGDATGGSLQLQLAGSGSVLSTTFPSVRDDPSGDSYSYSSGTGLFQWTWPAGQTDGAVIKLPYPRLADDPLAPWSITFSTLDFSGLDGFVFLANGQEIDLGSTGFNLTLGIPLAGDFNFDGSVDAADYVVWRKTDGTPPGYNLWRTHFGEPAGSGSGASVNTTVPEPATLVMFIVSAAGVLTWRLRTWRVS